MMCTLLTAIIKINKNILYRRNINMALLFCCSELSFFLRKEYKKHEVNKDKFYILSSSILEAVFALTNTARYRLSFQISTKFYLILVGNAKNNFPITSSLIFLPSSNLLRTAERKTVTFPFLFKIFCCELLF